MEDHRERCSFGERCNRKDSEHFIKFYHVDNSAKDSANTASVSGTLSELHLNGICKPEKRSEKITSWRSNAQPIERSPCILDVEIDDSDDEDIELIEVVVPKGQMAKKLKNAAPYNYFLTTIASSEPTHTEPLSINFLEILDSSLGELESSVQLTYMLDLFWLLTNYKKAGYLDKPLFIIYGDEPYKTTEMKPRVTLKYIKPPIGLHHTKIMLLGYTDGSMRIVMGSANLYEADWYNRTQGIWMSNTLRRLPKDVQNAGESPTGFRRDLIYYLMQYRNENLEPWIDRIRKTDFRSVNVFLVASMPGNFRDPRRANTWGHLRLGLLLEKYSPPIAETAPIVAQSSSIGVLGSGPGVWIESNMINSLRKNRSSVMQSGEQPELKMVYPSTKNYENCYVGGGCLPYEDKVNRRQLWFQSYLYQWNATKRFRSQAMPHMKSYFRYSDKGLHWFVLTSSNFSKSAWGFTKNLDSSFRYQIFNYEAGILFLPGFVIGKDVFPMDSIEAGKPPFPMPYDLPLTKYEPDDYPKVVKLPEEPTEEQDLKEEPKDKSNEGPEGNSKEEPREDSKEGPERNSEEEPKEDLKEGPEKDSKEEPKEDLKQDSEEPKPEPEE